jgi:CheY-like chemotaxis protein
MDPVGAIRLSDEFLDRVDDCYPPARRHRAEEKMSGPAQLAVFVLEDEALIRMMIVQMLEELVHRVIAEAGSIAKALPLAETANFDLALLDINIGGGDSGGIASVIKRRRLPLLFVSGYSPTGLPEPFQGWPVLQKPFSIQWLKMAVEQTMNPPRAHDQPSASSSTKASSETGSYEVRFPDRASTTTSTTIPAGDRSQGQ